MKYWLLALLLMLHLLPALAQQVVVHGLFSGRAVVSIDGVQRILRVGETSPEGVKLLQADSREAVLEIGGEQRRLGLGTHIGSSFSGPQLVETHIWPDQRGMYTTVGSINGLTVTFLVDTGATSIAMNSTEARRLGIDYRVRGERGTASTASGIVPVYRVNLAMVKVGEIALRNVTAVVIEGRQPDMVLLGMSFLGRLDLRREGESMVLKQKY